MGWPRSTVFKRTTERELRSLIGEGIHLGNLGIVFYAVFLQKTAPWWTGEVKACDQSLGKQTLPAKKRRTGC